MKNRLFQVSAELGEGWELWAQDARLEDYELGYAVQVRDGLDGGVVMETWSTTLGDAVLQIESQKEELFPLMPTVARNALIEEIERARKYRLASEHEYMLLGTILKDQTVPFLRLLPT